MFGSSGKFAKGIDALEIQAKRALFGLKSIFQRHPEMLPKTQLQLFNSLVKPILDYSCEIWGYLDAVKLETIHLNILKYILDVRKTVPTAYVYSEMNATPLHVSRKLSVIKYWLNILKLDVKHPVRLTYNVLRQAADDSTFPNWTTHIKFLLQSNGFGYIWENQNTVNDTYFLNQFKRRLSDTFLQTCNDLASQTSRNRFYNNLSPRINGTHYLFDIKERFLRVALSRMRLGSHNLMVERGRWTKPRKTPYPNRVCRTCGTVEDEYHIIIDCPRFSTPRQKYIPKNLTTRPSMFKLINFIDTAKDKKLRRFAFFCFIALKIYDSNL